MVRTSANWREKTCSGGLAAAALLVPGDMFQQVAPVTGIDPAGYPPPPLPVRTRVFLGRLLEVLTVLTVGHVPADQAWLGHRSSPNQVLTIGRADTARR